MIEIQINDALKALCHGRVSPLVTPQKTKTPYICYTKISEVYGDVMSGQSYVEYCFQIDVYAKTLFESENVIKEVYAKLKPFKPFNVNIHHDHESDTGLYRSTIEFFLLN